jgi:hypothetical protein
MLTRYYYNKKIKDDEVDSACSMHGNKGKCMQRKPVRNRGFGKYKHRLEHY